MHLSIPASFLAGTVALASTAHAFQCPPEWQSRFAAPGVDGAVNAIVRFPDTAAGDLWLGGAFTHAHTLDAAHIARWNASGWTTPGSGLDGNVEALLVFDDGSGPALYAGGAFTHAGGVPADGIARWNGSAWSSVGAGLSGGSVRALAVHDSGSGPALIAAGSFTSSGATSLMRVASWNGSVWTSLGTNGFASGSIECLVAHDDGGGAALYAGGKFTLAGDPTLRSVARLQGSTWQVPGAGLDDTVYTLCSFDEGSGPRLFAGGDFIASGLDTSVRWWARWDGATWSSVAGYAQGRLRSLRVLDVGDGVALWAGALTGQGRPMLHRWDGSALTDLLPNHSDVEVHALETFDDGDGLALYLGGDLARVVPGRGNVGRTYGGAVSSLPPSTYAGFVSVLASYRNASGTWNRLHAAAENSFDGTTPPSKLASWDGTSWQPITADAPVRTLCVHDDGNGARLFAGGFFTQLDGVAAAGVAVFDGASWTSAAQGLPYPTLNVVQHLEVCADPVTAIETLYASFYGSGQVWRWNGSSWSSIPIPVPLASIVVFAFESFDDGGGRKLYAAGGNPSAPPNDQRVITWDGTSWSTLAGGLNSTVTDMLVFDDGTGEQLYFAGYFTTAGAVAAPYVARYGPAGWSAVGAGLSVGVQALQVYDDGTGAALYAISAGTVHRWNGVAWSAVGASLFRDAYGTLSAGNLHALAVHDAGDGRGPELYVGGSMHLLDGSPAAGVGVYGGCRASSFCAGDGLDPAQTVGCPCGNTGAPGHGCAWHANPAGAHLQLSGSVQPDTLVLLADGMPAVAPGTVFWKSDAHSSDAIVWGDGLRCIDGNLIRLGTKVNVAGTAQYPQAGNAPISVRGQTPSGSGLVAYYQTSFRNAAAFCMVETFNATNGVRVVW